VEKKRGNSSSPYSKRKKKKKHGIKEKSEGLESRKRASPFGKLARIGKNRPAGSLHKKICLRGEKRCEQ